MELKKNPSKDIHARYPMHFFASLCISCGLVIGVFELKFKKEPVVSYDPPCECAMTLLDPNFQIDTPPSKAKKMATPVRTVRTVVPATIAVATTAQQETPLIAQVDPFEPAPIPASTIALPKVSDDPIVFAEDMPEPVNGFDGFYKQLARELRYPRKAVHAEVEGKVFVEFVIDRDGNPTLVRVIRGIGYGCDEEAIKALLKTRWIPGRQHGSPVRVRMIMPIQFALTR